MELTDPDDIFSDELTDAEADFIRNCWPNCSVADCEYKANIPDSDMCCFHQQGLVPPRFEDYMNLEPYE